MAVVSRESFEDVCSAITRSLNTLHTHDGLPVLPGNRGYALESAIKMAAYSALQTAAGFPFMGLVCDDDAMLVNADRVSIVNGRASITAAKVPA